MAVSTGTEILIIDPEYRVYMGVVPASPGNFSSLSTDGSMLAVSESAGFGQIQFYGGAPDYSIPLGQISSSPGQGSAFRFTDNAGGYFAMDQGLPTALFRGYPSGQFFQLLDNGRRNQGAQDVPGYGTVFLSSDAGGGPVGLYSLKNGIVMAIYENAADDVGWFSASGDGTVLVYSVYGSANPGFHILRNGFDTILNGASPIELDSPTSFDLSRDGKYMVFSIFGGSIRLLNIRGEQTQPFGISTGSPVVSIDLPCNVFP